MATNPDVQKRIDELKAEIKRLRQESKQKPGLDPSVVTKAVDDLKELASQNKVKPSELLTAMAKKMKLGVSFGRAQRGTTGAEAGR